MKRRIRLGQSGLTLIEVLVAVLVLSVGVLGIAALNMVSMQHNRSALNRAEAVLLANDIIDRIRANPGGAYATALGGAPPSPSDCTALLCTAGQMAQFDVAQWKCSLGKYNDDAGSPCPGLGFTAGALPEGDGAVVQNGSHVTVTIQWVDDTSGNLFSVAFDTTI